MNVQLVMTGVLSFFWGGFITPLSIRLAREYQIIDLPDYRKIHKSLTPRGAGFGLWAGYMLWSLYFAPLLPAVRYSAAAATLVFFCGYMDDMKPLSPFIRLAAHFAAASAIALPLPLPLLSKSVCLFWIAGVTSAYNFIDGINGLCISVFIASAVALCVAGGLSFGVAGAAMALGVFCWNFPRAETFLGDGGSTLLGFLFASHFVITASPVAAKASFHELVLLLLLWGGVPVLDTLIAFSRRILKGKSPFYPDKGHLHHRLLDLTRSALGAVACLLAMQVMSLTCAVAALTKLRA